MPRPASPQPNPFYPGVIPSAAKDLLLILASVLLCFLISCSGTKFDPTSLTFLIEANPVNLDPRFATDGQSQRLDGLIFSGLLARDTQMQGDRVMTEYYLHGAATTERHGHLVLQLFFIWRVFSFLALDVCSEFWRSFLFFSSRFSLGVTAFIAFPVPALWDPSPSLNRISYSLLGRPTQTRLVLHDNSPFHLLHES